MQSTALIKTLKQALKKFGLTYADIAQQLDMSEANIKRLFATGRFSLQRLEQVCQLMQLELSDLFELYHQSRLKISRLSLDQEKELVSDIKLLLVAVSVRNHLSYDEIISNYQISATECIQYLARLDRLKLIDLLPGNQIKLSIDENFQWLPGGPIEQFFNQQIQQQFLQSRFNQEMEQRRFLFALLSDSSVQIMLNKIQSLTQEFNDLHRQDSQLPLHKRHSIGFMLALRPWQMAVFEPLIKA